MGDVVGILDRHGRRVSAEPQTESISDLIHRCNAAVEKMGNGNPHKRLVYDCARALRMLCDRMAAIENPAEPVILDRAPGASKAQGAVDGKQ